jgi:hypothetical protein
MKKRCLLPEYALEDSMLRQTAENMKMTLPEQGLPVVDFIGVPFMKLLRMRVNGECRAR